MPLIICKNRALSIVSWWWGSLRSRRHHPDHSLDVTLDAAVALSNDYDIDRAKTNKNMNEKKAGSSFQ